MTKSTKTEAHNEFLTFSHGRAGQFVSGGGAVVSLLFNGDLGICPRDILAVLGQWIQGKLVQVTLVSLFSIDS